jgi:hypothetical protein
VKKKSVRLLKAKCNRVFSEYIRRKDAIGGITKCYTCNAYLDWKRQAQCGHGIGGRHNAVLYDESICRAQCVRCNVFLRGNYPIFTTKLIKENGMDWWEKKLDGARQLVKLTRSDIEDLIQTYKQKLEELPA